MIRRDRSAGILLALLAAAMVCWLWKPLQHANDIWWHLASGRYMVQHGLLPRTDVFSFTANGRPWINHEWLFQIAAFLSFQIAGLKGVLLLKVFLIVGAFA